MFRAVVGVASGSAFAIAIGIVSLTHAQAPRAGGAAPPQAPPAAGAAAPTGRGAAPLGVVRQPIGDGPWTIDTAEQHRVKVVSIARGLVTKSIS